MSGNRVLGLLAGAALLVSGRVASAEGLTILWAEWDPANYLQELVSEYTAETGVRVTVETTTWPDFQNKTFLELNAHGDTYDMVVGDSQWLGVGATEGHYVELTGFFAEHKLADLMTPASIRYYSEYPAGSRRYWAIPLEGDALGWAYRKDWFEDRKEMAAFKAKYRYDLAVPKTYAELRDIAEFFYRPNEKKYGIAIYTDSSNDALAMGVESAIFSYGGELGDYAGYKVDGITNSREAARGLEMYRELYRFTPPGWTRAIFSEDSQAITSDLAAMSMNFFAFFPPLVNKAINPNADVTGFFANPAGPAGKRFSALGGQGISLIAYSKNQAAALKFLAWLAKDETQKEWARLGGYTCSQAVLSSAAFQNATPFNRAFYESMFMVKDFWATPEYAALLDQMNRHVYPFVVLGQGTAQEALDATAADWSATLRHAGH